MAPDKAGILLGGERDLVLEILLLLLLGEVSILGENPLDLDDQPPLLWEGLGLLDLNLRCGDREKFLDLGDLDLDLEYLPLDLVLDLEYLLGDLEFLLGDLKNLLLEVDLLRDVD